MRKIAVPVAFLLSLSLLLTAAPQADPRLKKSSRSPIRGGWIQVHLEGSPSEIGFQHGYLLASEIKNAREVIALELRHENERDWKFFRDTAEKILWPHIDTEYREELAGIAEGLRAQRIDLDTWDVVALNAFLELPYYVNWLKKQKRAAFRSPEPKVAERCSAFVATGSYTRDGKVVIGHNAWTGYMDGQRWNIVFDIVPRRGHRMFMDGFPGLIHSADDFGVNSAGIAITETTISNFSGWDSSGVPEFVRARRAMQYSESIDDFARLMKEGNNGGYANNWLVADIRRNEIASLELGLKNVELKRSMDGYFVGANFPVQEKLISEETEFPASDPGVSANARHKRWEQLMAEYKGKIDAEAGQRFLSDHYDAHEGKVDPNERTLCGHIDLSPRGIGGWQDPFGVAGAVQAKVADARMAGELSFWARMGHPCGTPFKAADHLKKHAKFGWMKHYLRDIEAQPWTLFSAAR